LIRTSALYFARIIHSKPGLLWNVDLGFSLTHSQTVLKYGSLENSLTMGGVSEAYHIGPSYISGIISNYFKIGIDILSLLILPSIFLCVFVFASKLIVNKLVNNEKYELIIPTLICFTPGIFVESPTISTILDSNLILNDFIYNLPFQFSTMQNSMMAGSAIMCIFYFIVKSIKENLYLIFSTSLSLYTIKPLYFVSAFCFVSLFLLLSFSTKNSLGLSEYYKNLKYIFKFKNIFFLIIILSIWFYFYKFNLKPFMDASISFSFFIDVLNDFKYFDFNFIKDILKITFNLILNLPLISSSIFFILLILKLNKKFNLDKEKTFFINYSIILFIISIVLTLFSQFTPLSYIPNGDAIAIGQKMGITANKYGEVLVDENQATYPLYALVTIIGISSIASILKKEDLVKFNFFIKSKNIILSIIILLNSFYTSILIGKNNYIDNHFSRKRDEINATEYYRLIKEIPTEGSLLLSNSVEQGYYGRNFRNTYLTAFTTHDHFLANIRDYHWRTNTSETLRRLEEYYRIFPKNISLIGIYNPESISVVRKNKISHLILKKIPNEENNASLPGLKFLNENDSWILYQVINDK
tara:strand:- start:2721 stop:4472 length:1752 start_codon:yes stop_codon:yes gene_type:complete